MLLTTGNPLNLATARQPGAHDLGPFMQVIREESVNAEANPPPVLFQSSLVESNFLDWRSGNSVNSYLFAPFAAYPMKNRLVPLPFRISVEAEDYIAGLLRTDLRNQHKIILVTHDLLHIPWFAARFKEAGFTEKTALLNDYTVMVFERHEGAEVY